MPRVTGHFVQVPQVIGNGETAERIRTFNWASTPLGALAAWPEPLLTALNMMLGSRDPLLLLAGPEMVLLYNDGFAAILRGADPDFEILGSSLGGSLPVELRSLGEIEPALRYAARSFRENALVVHNGAAVENAFRYSPVYGASGQLLGILARYEEPAAASGGRGETRTLAGDALRVSEARFRALSSSSPAGVFESELDGRLRYGNPRLQSIWQISEPEMKGFGWTARVHPEDLTTLLRNWTAANAQRRSFEMEYRLLLPDGTLRWMYGRSVVVTDEENRPLWAIGTVDDITERKLAEEALRLSEERFRGLSASSPVGIFEADLDANVRYTNPRLQAMWEMEEKELLGRGWVARIHPEDVPALVEGWAGASSSGQPFELEYRLLLPSGQIRWIYGRSVIVKDERGRPLGTIGTVDDISSRRQAEERLRRTEKLAAVGQLASSIAHEINNPLEAVTNLLYLARVTDDPGEARTYLEQADAELRRMSEITIQTLRFHKQSTRPTACDCSELISAALSIYQSRIARANVTLAKRLRARVAAVCYEGEIRQVLSNLIGNAVDAMQLRGGRLLVRSREGTDWISGEKGLIMTIADTGPGMSAGTRAQIFEPFFTTKGMGGTGLGLWISQDIVANHGGRIRVRSSQCEERSGTVFTLFLPFAAAERGLEERAPGTRLTA